MIARFLGLLLACVLLIALHATAQDSRIMSAQEITSEIQRMNDEVTRLNSDLNSVKAENELLSSQVEQSLEIAAQPPAGASSPFSVFHIILTIGLAGGFVYLYAITASRKSNSKEYSAPSQDLSRYDDQLIKLNRKLTDLDDGLQEFISTAEQEINFLKSGKSEINNDASPVMIELKNELEIISSRINDLQEKYEEVNLTIGSAIIDNAGQTNEEESEEIKEEKKSKKKAPRKKKAKKAKEKEEKVLPPSLFDLLEEDLEASVNEEPSANEAKETAFSNEESPETIDAISDEKEVDQSVAINNSENIDSDVLAEQKDEIKRDVEVQSEAVEEAVDEIVDETTTNESTVTEEIESIEETSSEAREELLSEDTNSVEEEAPVTTDEEDTPSEMPKIPEENNADEIDNEEADNTVDLWDAVEALENNDAELVDDPDDSVSIEKPVDPEPEPADPETDPKPEDKPESKPASNPFKLNKKKEAPSGEPAESSEAQEKVRDEVKEKKTFENEGVKSKNVDDAISRLRELTASKKPAEKVTPTVDTPPTEESATASPSVDDAPVEEAPSRTLQVRAEGRSKAAISFDERLNNLKDPEQYALLSRGTPNDKELKENWALSLIQRGLRTENDDDIIDAINLVEPIIKNGGVKEGMAHQILADGLFALGKLSNSKNFFTRANTQYKKVTEKTGYDGVSMYTNWGNSLIEMYYLTKKRNYLTEALDKFKVVNNVYTHGGSYDIARVFFLLNQQPAAMEWLENAFKTKVRLPKLEQILSDRAFTNLGEHPHFQKLIKQYDIS